MFTDRVMRIAFLLSMIGHLLVLGAPFGIMSNLQIEKEPEDIELVYVEIIKTPLLPKIDVLGEKKKLEEVTKEQKQQFETELKAQPNKIEVVQELKPDFKKPIEEVALKKMELESVKEKVKILNPANEAMLRYQDMVKQRIEEVRKYPSWAKRQEIEGEVYINFIVLSNGLSRDIKIIRSSGSKILDEEAVETVKRASPFPSIPKEISNSWVQMEVFIVFRLK